MINVFLTNLGKYNEGELVGKWISLPIDTAELENCLEEIGINEEYEEYFITDSETDIEYLDISEYSNLQELNEIAEKYDEMDDDEKMVLSAFMLNGDDFSEAVAHVQEGDYYMYPDCRDMEDVAIEVVEQCGYLQDVPDAVARYFDYEAFGEDLAIEGTFVYINGCYVQIL